MQNGRIVVMLVYEPVSVDAGPVPLIRVFDDALAVAVAESAVFEAETHAREIAHADELLGEIEQIDVRRLRELFSLVVPGFGKQNERDDVNDSVM